MADEPSSPKIIKMGTPIEKIDDGNRYVKELKLFLKSNFVQISNKMYTYILLNSRTILDTKKIVVNELFKEESEQNQFLKKNSARVENGCLQQGYTDSIINYIIRIKNEEIKAATLSTETRANEYRNVILKNNKILPDEDFDIASLKLNLFYDNKIEFDFNEDIPVKELDKTSSFVQTLKLEINGSGDQIVVPTKYEVICTARVGGVECSNIINFCDIHKNSSITCSDSPTRKNPGHTLKKIDIAPVKENVVFYVYEGKDILNEKGDDLKIFSLVEINKEKITCSAVHVIENKEEYIIILNIKIEESDLKLLTHNILLKDPKSRHFLDDIYKSLQKYLLKEHSIVLTNQNKIVGEIIIFVLLNKIFYDIRMNAMIVGSSGAGKSFWSQYVIPMFTFSHKIISGSDVTRNRFLGGRSNLVSAFKNSTFQVGFMGTQDVVFCEEGTEPLNKFFDPNTDKNNNVFNMLKIASGPYDISIQGSRSITPKASCILVGNLEQLNHIQKYKDMVRKKYRNYSGGGQYKNHWSLFRPLEFYQNQDLAKAHMQVRKNEWLGHYVTKLPEAEQARFDFLIALEDEETEFKKPEMTLETVFKRYHRAEFITELKEIFNQKIPHNLKREIYNYFTDEYLKGRNNIMKNGYKKLNTQILNRQVDIATQFIFLNKLYCKQEMQLTEMDKRLFEGFMLYNYNCINAEEAALIKKPFINDYLGITDEDSLTEFDTVKKEEYVKKLEAEQKEIEDMIEGDDLLK